MSDEPQDGPEAIQPAGPPPLPLKADPLGPPPPPINRKKVFWIIGLSLLAAAGVVVVGGALIFGGCMYLVEKLGHQ